MSPKKKTYASFYLYFSKNPRNVSSMSEMQIRDTIYKCGLNLYQ